MDHVHPRAGPLHSRVPEGAQALLPLQGHLVRLGEERQLWHRRRTDGLHRRAEHQRWGRGCRALHYAGRRAWLPIDSGARRILGAGSALIRLEGVHKSFGPKVVLAGLSLQVPAGMNTVIIGGSGSGKSVTLKLIVGLLEPDAGRIEVDGRNVPDLDRDELAQLRGQIGYVFQFAALFDSMTVAENIRLGLVKRGLDEASIRDRIRESLDTVELSGQEDRYPAELSGGMRKRAGIARAVALRPRYILYDEPTTGLDPVTAAVMDRLMQRTRDLGVTGVVVTHDMRSAFTVGDRIAMLHDGVIRQIGTVAEIKATSDPIIRQFIEGRPDTEAPPLRRAAQ